MSHKTNGVYTFLYACMDSTPTEPKVLGSDSQTRLEFRCLASLSSNLRTTLAPMPERAGRVCLRDVVSKAKGWVCVGGGHKHESQARGHAHEACHRQ